MQEAADAQHAQLQLDAGELRDQADASLINTHQQELQAQRQQAAKDLKKALVTDARLERDAQILQRVEAQKSQLKQAALAGSGADNSRLEQEIQRLQRAVADERDASRSRIAKLQRQVDGLRRQLDAQDRQVHQLHAQLAATEGRVTELAVATAAGGGDGGGPGLAAVGSDWRIACTYPGWTVKPFDGP